MSDCSCAEIVTPPCLYCLDQKEIRRLEAELDAAKRECARWLSISDKNYKVAVELKEKVAALTESNERMKLALDKATWAVNQYDDGQVGLDAIKDALNQAPAHNPGEEKA